MERLRGTAVPNGPGPPVGGTGYLPKRRSVPLEGLRGMALPNSLGPAAGGTGSPAQVAFAAYGGPTGHGSSQQCGPTSQEDGESCPCVGRYLWRACEGWQFPTARAHQLGGRGVLPRRRSVPMEGLRGAAFPNGPGPPARGTGSPI